VHSNDNDSVVRSEEYACSRESRARCSRASNHTWCPLVVLRAMTPADNVPPAIEARVPGTGVARQKWPKLVSTQAQPSLQLLKVHLLTGRQGPPFGPRKPCNDDARQRMQTQHDRVRTALCSTSGKEGATDRLADALGDVSGAHRRLRVERAAEGSTREVVSQENARRQRG
jgi:hypothetical protein